MNLIFCIVSTLVVLATGTPCAQDHEQLLLFLNKELLRSVEDKDSLPNPSVHLALRLSKTHNLNKENEHLNNLKTKIHNDIESSLNKGQAVLGRLALYTLALKSSCHDINSLTFSVNQKSESLLTHLKRQMENEKEHIAFSQRPLTTYYQYSVGILALCLSGVRVNPHVNNKLIHAVEHGLIEHGDSVCIDTYAMAGMALQCLKNGDSQVMDAAHLDKALAIIKQKLLNSQQADGHMGNEYSTGLAVQALLAMGTDVHVCAASMEALRADIRKGTYHSSMAMSQGLPALQQQSYLSLRGKECRNEDDTLVLDATSPVIVLPSQTKIVLLVELVKSDNKATSYTIEVPKGLSLLEALTLLQENQAGFKFETELSLWGPFLSSVNGEQARQSDRRYWRLSSNDETITQGVADYKIEAAQKITIKNTSY